MLRPLLVLILFSISTPALLAQREFGFDNRKPSGQPYLPAEETVKRFTMPDGWEASVFAAEPNVINPVAFTVDEKGRVWVVECFEYPSRTPKGKKPRDRIKILEDTDGDGKCDKVTVWAEGKDLPIGWDLATGIEVGHGGVFLGAPPYLFFLSDPDNTGKCTKQEILLKGFGSQDTHETLNTFQWGPDSKLYGLHGVFTVSDVDGVKMNAAVWRYDVNTKKFEIFAEGTSNPWGMDFDKNGQCFLACCVIPHLFHMVPGGTYRRQAGSSFNPYAYGLLPEICDHTHHKLSGWAHAGLISLEGEHIPADLKGSLVMGSIHGCSLKRNTLKPNGSTFIGSSAPDFLVSADKNVRPINLRWAQDGSIYFIDWHDQNPCHQAPADSWDQKFGRVYRLQRKRVPTQKNEDVAKKSTDELISLLQRENPYWYRTATRLLVERKDKSAAPKLAKLFDNAKNPTHALRALWTLHGLGAFDAALGKKALDHADPWVRSWGVRFLGEDGKLADGIQDRLVAMAKNDPAPQVRLQLASTCQDLRKANPLPIIQQLLKHAGDKKDIYLPLMIWLAYEPHVVGQRNPVLDWLKDNAIDNALVVEEIVPRVMRRLTATGKTEDLEAAIVFIGEVKNTQVRKKALEGLLAGIKGPVDAPPSWPRLAVALTKEKDSSLHELGGRLAILFSDRKAIAHALATARDLKKSDELRVSAIRDLSAIKPKEAQPVLAKLVFADGPVAVRVEACRGLAGYDSADLAKNLIGKWKDLPQPVRAEAVNLLAGRKAWAKELLAGVGKGAVARAELNDNTILRILGFKDKSLNQQVEKVWGKFRDSPKELASLIEKMRAELHLGTASFERGRKVFEAQCAKCHRFEGKGHLVGPELDGAARDTEYLLGNILDPNRVIGQPYLLRLVELSDGRIESGLLHAEDEKTITLKVENNQLKTIAHKDIEGKVRVLDKSMMPEGLAATMTVQDFRDLVKYVMAHPFITEATLENSGAKTKISVGPGGRLSLPDIASKSQKVILIATVDAPHAMRTRLFHGANASAKFFLNDSLVDSSPGSKAAAEPDTGAIEAALKAGVNVLRVELQYTGKGRAVYLRFFDPERKLRYAEASSH